MRNQYDGDQKYSVSGTGVLSLCGRSTGSHKVAWQTWNQKKGVKRNCMSSSFQLKQPDSIVGIVLPAELETLKTHWLKLCISQEGAGQSVWGLLLSLSFVSPSKIDWFLSKHVNIPTPLRDLPHSNMYCLYSLAPWETSISLEGYMEKPQQIDLLVVAELWVKYFEFCCWSYSGCKI